MATVPNDGQSVLIHFQCPTCPYIEDVGVGVSMGIVFKGSFTIVCPKCGFIVFNPDVVVMLPARFKQLQTRSPSA